MDLRYMGLMRWVRSAPWMPRTFQRRILSEQAMVRRRSPALTPSHVWMRILGLMGTVPIPHSILDRSMPLDESADFLEASPLLAAVGPASLSPLNWFRKRQID